jgi:hypothetical protein
MSRLIEQARRARTLERGFFIARILHRRRRPGTGQPASKRPQPPRVGVRSPEAFARRSSTLTLSSRRIARDFGIVSDDHRRRRIDSPPSEVSLQLPTRPSPPIGARRARRSGAARVGHPGRARSLRGVSSVAGIPSLCPKPRCSTFPRRSVMAQILRSVIGDPFASTIRRLERSRYAASGGKARCDIAAPPRQKTQPPAVWAEGPNGPGYRPPVQPPEACWTFT